MKRLAPRAAGVDGPLLDRLKGTGVRTLADVIPMLPENYDQFTELASAAQPKAAADAMLSLLRKLSALQKLQADLA